MIISALNVYTVILGLQQAFNSLGYPVEFSKIDIYHSLGKIQCQKIFVAGCDTMKIKRTQYL